MAFSHSATMELRRYAERDVEWPTLDYLRQLILNDRADPNITGRGSELNFVQVVCATFATYDGDVYIETQRQTYDFILGVLDLFLSHSHFDFNRVNDGDDEPRTLLHIIAGTFSPYTHLFIQKILQHTSKNGRLLDLNQITVSPKDVDDSHNGRVQTALICMADHRITASQVEGAKLLLEAGADPNALDSHGQTALHNLFYSLQHELEFRTNPIEEKIANVENFTQILMQHGADVNLKTATTGFTVLHEAALRPSPAVSLKTFRMLLQGANLSIKSRRGETPLDIAHRTGCRNMIEAVTERRIAIAMLSSNKIVGGKSGSGGGSGWASQLSGELLNSISDSL
jgi:ankyrin repeat protein